MAVLAQNPVVLRPRDYLTASQINILLDLDRCGPAYKVNNGWKLGGFFRKASTVKPLSHHHLVEDVYRFGKHRLALTWSGRAVVQALEPRSRAKAS